MVGDHEKGVAVEHELSRQWLAAGSEGGVRGGDASRRRTQRRPLGRAQHRHAAGGPASGSIDEAHARRVEQQHLAYVAAGLAAVLVGLRVDLAVRIHGAAFRANGFE